MDTNIEIIELDGVNREDAARVALAMYAGEPCRICGKTIVREDLHEIVFAGYGKNGRSAHGDCWAKMAIELGGNEGVIAELKRRDAADAAT